MIHTVKGCSVGTKPEVDVSLELSCLFYDLPDVGNLISGSSPFSKSSVNSWKFLIHILLKSGLENFENYFASMWDECGEGNGNPLQCSCLENHRDGGACWAAIYGVAQSWTWLKRLSSSSSSPYITKNNKFPKSFIDEIQSMMIIGLLMRRLDSLGG